MELSVKLLDFLLNNIRKCLKYLFFSLYIIHFKLVRSYVCIIGIFIGSIIGSILENIILSLIGSFIGSIKRSITWSINSEKIDKN